MIMATMAHRTFIGFTNMRQADGAVTSMPNGRCKCGWVGPSRNVRADAEMDAQGHAGSVLNDDLAQAIKSARASGLTGDDIKACFNSIMLEAALTSAGE